MRKIRDWERSPDEVTVKRVLPANIVGVTEQGFSIEFRDEGINVIAAKAGVDFFNGFPDTESVEYGMRFSMATYTISPDNGIIVAPWPLTDYWDSALYEKAVLVFPKYKDK